MDMDKIVQDLKDTQWEMADEIEKLRTDNKNLRQVIKRLLQEFDFMIEDGIIPDVRNDVIFVRSRSTLEETKDGNND